MNTYQVCEKEFDEKYFDVEQNKCILHCEKDDWYEIEEFFLGRKSKKLV